MAKIENYKYSIQEAFQECFYIVPDYQREYVWTDKEVHQLLDDINEQIDGGHEREYFIGMVLVSPTAQKNHYEVIDGQQRLTTLFILLCALKQMFRGEAQHQIIAGLISASYVDKIGETQTNLKLEPRYENAGEVVTKLVELDANPQVVRTGIQAAGIPSFGSLENLVSAYSTIYRYLEDNYEDAAKLKKYWGYLANSVVFIQISTDVSSALKIFETINERGVGLNPMDLLKNLLFTQVVNRHPKRSHPRMSLRILAGNNFPSQRWAPFGRRSAPKQCPPLWTKGNIPQVLGQEQPVGSPWTPIHTVTEAPKPHSEGLGLRWPTFLSVSLKASSLRSAPCSRASAS